MTVRPAGLAGARGQAREKTRDAVLQAALRLFSEHGYLAVRVEDIAREAGVSRATFYKHFAEREEILAMLLTRLLGADEGAGTEVEQPAGDLAARVQALGRAIVDRMLEQEQLARFVYSLPVRHEALLGAQQLPRPSAFGRVDRLLDAADAAGELRDGVPLAVVRTQVHAAIETALREWATGQATDPHERLAQHLDVVLHGAAAPTRKAIRRR
ncbi:MULTISPECIES: TetR/AcrR family transcriptional regulator [unclassified Nocardioides]|uniref:TetR/AcrR family transcriptional regulator n=1 Tax=unclassified Nocardioides TaxID=2615069 RepID=UPI000056FA41|nr:MULTISPECIES: TetR/AcrR family transcriptional regulator [unclassified Nocardioides]ABL83741.1 transcriptional regulator, TetR family [Nocardioides sp. JS614]